MAFLGTDSITTADWTSDEKLTDRYDTIQGSILSNEAGSLKVQQSPDGENWDIEDAIAVTANTGTKIDVKILLPVVRLFFDNTGATVPTTFRVSAKLTAAGDS